MDFRQIEYFAEIARRGSFLKGAAALGLTQPALSRQIALLERELECRLFDRGRSGVALTSEGERLLGRVTELLDLWTQVRSSVDPRQERWEKSYSLCAGGTMAAYVLPRLLARIRRRHGVQFQVVEVDAAEAVDLLTSGRVDLGIVTAPVSHTALNVLPWMRDEIVPVVPRSEPSRRMNLASFLKRDFVLYHPASAVRRLVDNRIRSLLPGTELRAAMELRTVDSVVRSVEAGLGAGFVSRFALTPKLRVVPIRELHVEREFVVAHRKSRTGLGALLRELQQHQPG